MKKQFSALYYRSPEAIKDFNEKLNKEVAEFKSMENKPEAIRAAITRMKLRRETNKVGGENTLSKFGGLDSSMGDLLISDDENIDAVLERHGAKFLGTVFFNLKEYHIWGHELDESPILIELNILKEELAQAYARIDELQKKSVEDSWKGCVDRQGGSFDNTDWYNSNQFRENY